MTSEIVSQSDTLLRKIKEWTENELPHQPKNTEDFGMINKGDQYGIMEDMVHTTFSGDPRNSQENGMPTPKMWITEAYSKDTIQFDDLDVKFWGGGQEGIFQAAIHRIGMMGNAIRIIISEREDQNFAALSKTLVGYKEIKREHAVMKSTARWSVELEYKEDSQELDIILKREKFYYLWGFWSKSSDSGRESAMAKPVEKKSEKIYTLPRPTR